MKSFKHGLLVNQAGKGRYFNRDAPDLLIRYVTRTDRKPADDLITWGGLGVAEFMGIEAMGSQFHAVQEMHKQKGSFGRRADHEVYSFSMEEMQIIEEENLDVDRIARKMAYDFYDRDHCQVVYGVHKPDKGHAHMHVHFAVNTVKYTTGNKRRENMRQTRERQERFSQIVREEAESESML